MDQRKVKAVRGEGTGVRTKVVAGWRRVPWVRVARVVPRLAHGVAGFGGVEAALIRVPKTADAVAIESGEHCSFRNYGVAPQGCGYVPITFKCVMGSDGDAV